MVRKDVPTLECDRCKMTTQDTKLMGSFNKLTHYHMGGSDEWDLCPDCWKAYRAFMDGKPDVPPELPRPAGVLLC